LENLDKLMSNIHDYLKVSKLIDNTIVCIVGDHGEMLGDHGILGKKVPWQASISVPLVCFGPGIKEGIVYKDPVTTLDLPGTFMDFAGTKPNDDMTTQSLRSFMTEGTLPTREFVSSGLMKWRLVVQVVDDVAYKLICCKGPCSPAPKSVKPPVGDWHMLLYDTQADRFDMSPIEDKPDVVEKLRKNLPDGWCPDEATIKAKKT
jgi:arylsulfatase A-like enzyme